MAKNVVKINESVLRQIVAESVENTLKEVYNAYTDGGNPQPQQSLEENAEEEGLFKNVLAAARGARDAYRAQKFADTDIDSGYGNANTNYNAMVQGVKTKADAAKTYDRMMKIARDYEQKAADLRAKMNSVYSEKGIDNAQNRQGGKFAKGFNTQDNTKSTGTGAAGSIASRGRELSGKRDSVSTGQAANLQRGMAPTGNIRESFDARLNQIISESIRKVVNEEEMEENFWDNLRAAAGGAKRGYKTQNALDTNMSRYQNDAERRQSGMFAGNALDSLTNKMYYKDAKSSGQDMYAMAREYDQKAADIRSLAKQLAQKWGVTAISKVGAAGPTQYGYGGRALPGTKPGVVGA